jgi:hypothetical protein
MRASPVGRNPYQEKTYILYKTIYRKGADYQEITHILYKTIQE